MTKPTQWQQERLKRKLIRLGMQEHTQGFSEGQMHYWAGGHGMPMVLLHGFGVTSLWQWHTQIKHFIRYYRLIIPNLLGFGNSIPYKEDRTLAYQATTVIRLLDSLGIDSFHLLGMSYGGFVASQLCSLWPKRIGRLILVACPGDVMTRPDYQNILDLYEINDISELLLPDQPEKVRRLIELAWHRRLWIPSFALNDAWKTLFSVQPEVKREFLDALLLYLDEPPETTRSIRNYPLLIWGEHDPIFPVALGRKLQRSFGPRTPFHILPKTAHAPNLERPRLFNKLVLNFLRQRQ